MKTAVQQQARRPVAPKGTLIVKCCVQHYILEPLDLIINNSEVAHMYSLQWEDKYTVGYIQNIYFREGEWHLSLSGDLG